MLEETFCEILHEWHQGTRRTQISLPWLEAKVKQKEWTSSLRQAVNMPSLTGKSSVKVILHAIASKCSAEPILWLVLNDVRKA